MSGSVHFVDPMKLKVRSPRPLIPYVGRRRHATWPTGIPKPDRFCWAGRKRSFTAEWAVPQVAEPAWLDIKLRGRDSLLIEVLHGTLGVRHGASWAEVGPMASIAVNVDSIQIEVGLDREWNPHGARVLLHFIEPLLLRRVVEDAPFLRVGLLQEQHRVADIFGLPFSPSNELRKRGGGAACANPRAFLDLLFGTFDAEFNRFLASGPCKGMGASLPPVTKEDLDRIDETYDFLLPVAKQAPLPWGFP